MQEAGDKFRELMFAADEDFLLLPEETRRRLGLFDLLAGAIDLSFDTSHYTEALKVLRPSQATARWENHLTTISELKLEVTTI